MPKAVDFAPISSDRSLQLRIAAAYLLVSGVLILALLAIGMVGALLGNVPLRAALFQHPFSSLLWIGWGVGLLIAARALWRKLRWGGYLAIACYALPVLIGLVSGDNSILNLLVAAAGIVAITLAWSDLGARNANVL